MVDHACLRERKRDKNADGVERDQGMCVASKCDDQEAGKYTEKNNAVGEYQAIAACLHLGRAYSRRALRSTPVWEIH